MRPDNMKALPYGLCALPDDTIGIACGSGGLRAIQLNSPCLTPHSLYERNDVWRVAFDKDTETLLLALWEVENDICRLVSLRLEANEWVEVQRSNTRMKPCILCDLVVCETRVLLIKSGIWRLHAFDVSAEHDFSRVGSVDVGDACLNFACTRLHPNSFRLVALAHSGKVSLRRLEPLDLSRLEPLRLQQLKSIGFTDPRHRLFYGHMLLVADYHNDTRSSEVVSLLTSGKTVMRNRRVLLESNANVEVDEWCFAGNRLVLRDRKSDGNLLVYAFPRAAEDYWYGS